jgi:hypothetical protein
MIPAWNIAAVLPPIRPGAAGQSPDRSPDKASFSEVVERFAKSPARLEILRGLLKYRTELRSRGIASGFQWLDGSFMENKEVLLAEAPNDIDVVTFFIFQPGWMNQLFPRKWRICLPSRTRKEIIMLTHTHASWAQSCENPT